tara:strand:- start:5367 stop:6527 length:1161 start_codon:yes stop_codon:yes gene_type:complete
MMRPAKNLLDQTLDSAPGWNAKPFLQKVTDIVPSVIYVYNQRTQSNEYSNRSLGEALGFSSLEIKQMGAEMLARLCHPDDMPRIGAHFEHIATLADGHVADVEYRARHKNGNWVWLLSRDAVFQRDPDGAVSRHIGVAADITRQKEAEQRALAEQLKAEAANEELRSFSYAMSHDMKSPSNTLEMLLTELLASDDAALSDDAQELAELALTTARQMSKLVADVREYTALIGAQSDLQDVALDAVLFDVLSDLQISIRQSRAEVTVETLPAVRGDPAQLRLMFRNLVENAIRFHPPGTQPKVSVIGAPDIEVGKVAITVRDNGLGIDPRDQGSIFNVFKRLNPNGDYPGSGLGLPICRRIAATHGGKVDVTSQVGSGAAFTVRIPLA